MKLKFLLGFLLLTTLTFSQNGTVSGVITDKEYNNEPLPFANVLIKGTTIGTSTDDDRRDWYESNPFWYKKYPWLIEIFS